MRLKWLWVVALMLGVVLFSGGGQRTARGANYDLDDSVKSATTDDESLPEGYDPDKLYFTLRLGVWGLALSGDAGVGPLSTGVSMDFSDLIKDTNLAAFPSFELSKGNWVVAVNGLYANLSDSEHLTGPLGNGRGADVSANIGIVDVGLGYTIIRSKTTLGAAAFTLTPAIGGRWTYVDAEINPDNFPTESKSRNWFDPYIGLQAVVGLTRTLDWRTAGTVGGFGVGSQFTWSAETMLEWHFSKHVGLDVGYRVLSWDYDVNNFQWDITMQGPWIGISINN